jgi:uncharacterized secreted repeat protein (TIGR03808 family)
MTFSRRSLLAAGAIAAATPVRAAKGDQTASLQAAIDRAARGDGVVRLEAGRFITTGLTVSDTLHIEGVPGRTVLVGAGAGQILSAADAERVSLYGIAFEGMDQFDDLVAVTGVARVLIDSCSFSGSRKTALRLERCGGRMTGNAFKACGQSGLFALDSKGLEISGNHVHEMGNNGILVWTSEKAEDGTLITNNRIHNIEARDGGSGQNGNGINIYRAGNVIVSNNRISDCAFSAVRCNSASQAQILGNSISRMGEVSIYAEFGFEGAVISGNTIEDSVFGISITNFNEGGRLAVCANNLIRKLRDGHSGGGTKAGGIHAEADTIVSANVIEDAGEFGISLGWGPQCRNLTAQGNLVRGCGIGISASVSEGAGQHVVMNNVIEGARMGAIVGRDHEEIMTGDLGHGASRHPLIALANNIVRT